jgi:hypothetical protein
VILFTSYDRVAATTILRQFPPAEIIISLDVDLIGAAQISDSSFLLLYFPLGASPPGCTRVQKGHVSTPASGSASDPRSHHSVENLGHLVANASSAKKARNLQIFPFFISPNWTIIHYNKRAICICILLSLFRESVRSS